MLQSKEYNILCGYFKLFDLGASVEIIDHFNITPMSYGIRFYISKEDDIYATRYYRKYNKWTFKNIKKEDFCLGLKEAKFLTRFLDNKKILVTYSLKKFFLYKKNMLCNVVFKIK